MQLWQETTGLLQKAQNSQKESVIGQEKEAIRLAWNSLQIESRISGTPITTNIFEEELNKNNSNDAEVSYEDDDETKGFLVEFSKTHNQYTVDKNGKISYIEIIIEEDVEPTETIYATLYDDGTLAFSNDNSKDMNKVVINTYSIAKNDIFETEDDIPWKNERTQIQYVDFVNRVAPTNTARWFQRCENLLELKHIQNLNTNDAASINNADIGLIKIRLVRTIHSIPKQFNIAIRKYTIPIINGRCFTIIRNNLCKFTSIIYYFCSFSCYYKFTKNIWTFSFVSHFGSSFS